MDPTQEDHEETRKRTLTHVALAPDARQALVETLNELLASTYDLYTQVKQAHWNVKGLEFRALHELFDELAEHILEHGDEVAERAAQLGGYVRGTARLIAQGSRLSEYDLEALDGKSHVRALVAQYATLDARLRDGIEVGEEQGDPVTVDLLTQVARALEKDLWMLESHLN